MTNTASAERYLTVAEVARMMSVSEATVRRWIRDGRLAAGKVAGLQSVRVKESDVHRLIQPRG